ncbi:hypothetical protein NIES4071_41830 [Calothrix sp. NIES-4071]|jgi:hypothetical protein|nr:hypothetical protein NIES4071_41830 [Calothrix sp. NIES-4071]BAZ58499.1 hypothetical protein NIES4105_41770 [Calothrix sp. NIES-4105]
MSYSDFTFIEVLNKFGLTREERSGVFSQAAEIEPTDFFKTGFNRTYRLLGVSGTEKLRSEGIVYPLLSDLNEVIQAPVLVLSGIEFNIDPARGLNGRCDFLLSKSDELLEVRSPVVVVVEAKKEDIRGGIGQCLASMIAAQIFNSNNGDNINTIYGSVTSGTNWLFLKLEGSKVTIDLDEYFIDKPNKILGILAQAFN